MSNKESRISLSSRWCFVRDELVISFPGRKIALEYQQLNPEARIYDASSDTSDKDVYLPRPEGLISLRSSSQSEHFSFALEFRSEKEARAWDEKVSISTIFPERSRTHAYINKWFAMSGQDPEPRKDRLRIKPMAREKPYNEHLDRFRRYS